ncbi:MAG: OmpA family protein [Dysgonamonadaceae bacterium]|jgi:outer membrane protein OmpA-like peptidoglycan-associated protein|nr:OmpA family protein [Dysgonamonadaceae bacterium]
MKKKRFSFRQTVLLAVLALFSVSGSLSAQETEGNPFGRHWFVGFGAGPRIYYGDHNRQMDFKDRPSLGGELYFGKWWSPYIGTRIGYSLQNVNGATSGWTGSPHSTGVIYDGNRWVAQVASGDQTPLYYQKFAVGHLYGDALFNVTNLMLGNSSKRIYDLSPYIGVGWMRTWDSPQASEVSANVGLFNAFHLGNVIDLTLDVRGALVDDRFDGEVGSRKKEGIFSVGVGLVFNIGGRTWSAPGKVLSDAERLLLNDRITAIAGENDLLRDKLATVEYTSGESQVKTIVEKVTQWKDVATDVLVLFPINESVLTKDARVQLGFLADLMKKYPEGRYAITGYADEGTGNPDLNLRLSEARAKAVKYCLTQEFGIAAYRLETVAAGGIENRYYNDPALSRSAVIRPKK